MLIQDAWKTPTFADFKVTINDWAKTPVYLMAVEGMSEAAALACQLPVPAIKRLIFDCSDQQKDRELSLHQESSEYNEDLKEVGATRLKGPQRGSIDSADD